MGILNMAQAWGPDQADQSTRVDLPLYLYTFHLRCIRMRNLAFLRCKVINHLLSCVTYKRAHILVMHSYSSNAYIKGRYWLGTLISEVRHKMTPF